ncbi:MAG TPA: hypothetical protein VF515_14810 [Candidatus Binatia bacterium]|jgi:hypothetical protein
MNAADQADYVGDGISSARREQFVASEAAVQAWQRSHPATLDEYFDFLDGLQAIFGPFPVRRDGWSGDDFRL